LVFNRSSFLFKTARWINNNDISLNETRRIFIDELFPEQDLVQGTPRTLPTFDLAYYPDEQGPYNNSPNSSYLSNIKEKWAGISRSLNATNFEQSNVEFIEFWLLDTFSEQETTSNDLGELGFSSRKYFRRYIKRRKKTI
jgi:cell surface protein SprA